MGMMMMCPFVRLGNLIHLSDEQRWKYVKIPDSISRYEGFAIGKT